MNERKHIYLKKQKLKSIKKEIKQRQNVRNSKRFINVEKHIDICNNFDYDYSHDVLNDCFGVGYND